MGGPGRRQYRAQVRRGRHEEEEGEMHRTLEEYVKLVNKTTEFFSTSLPDEILAELEGYFD